MERSLGVLRNLTEEFGKEEYGGVVKCEFPPSSGGSDWGVFMTYLLCV